MAGTAVTRRRTSLKDSVEYEVPIQLNKVIADLETLRASFAGLVTDGLLQIGTILVIGRGGSEVQDHDDPVLAPARRSSSRRRPRTTDVRHGLPPSTRVRTRAISGAGSPSRFRTPGR